MRLQVPILPDVYGLNALDYAVGYSRIASGQADNFDSLYMPITPDVTRIIQNSMHLRLLQLILANTRDYSFKHSSQLIVDPVIAAVAGQLPSALDYLDSRIIPSTFLPKVLQSSLNKKHTIETDAYGKFGVLEIDNLYSKDQTEAEMFVEAEARSDKKGDSKDAENYL